MELLNLLIIPKIRTFKIQKTLYHARLSMREWLEGQKVNFSRYVCDTHTHVVAVRPRGEISSFAFGEYYTVIQLFSCKLINKSIHP